ncbi:MAG: tRNA dihydrouridine synthase DusB [Chitinispirillaceae bacterium]|nr:tRNA dihydrouridine synthase DusB [Chitinispirillaceae bacterium]
MPLQFKGLFLAPLAGVSETCYRQLCRRNGADAVVSEMVSAEGLLRKGKQTLRLCRFDEQERPFGLQLFGSDPGRMAAAAAWVEENVKPDFIDLNAGCPVRKVVGRGAGAALLKNPALFEKIVAAMVRAVSLPLTVKIRSGWNTGEWVDDEFARIAEARGAAAVILHARSKTMVFSGAAYWDRIRIVKKAIKIPLIGNGDIKSADDALRINKQTGCDGLMIGRGASGNPWIFNQIKLALAGRDPGPVTDEMRRETALMHITQVRDHYGEMRAVKEMRKHVSWYLRGQKKASVYRDRVFRSETTAELEAVVKEAWEER